MAARSSPAIDQLMVLGDRQHTREYVRDLWERRHFVMALARTDLRVRHLNSVLGQLWHLVNPALMISVYYFIFGVVLDARRGVPFYITFLVTGVVTFRSSQSTIVGCAGAIPKNLGLIRSIQFPRALIPLSITIEQVLAFLPAYALVILVAVIDGAPVSWRILLLPLVIAAGAIFSFGFGLTAARLGAGYSDFQQLLPHTFRVLFYVSGVLFSIEQSISNESIRRILSLNPFYGLIESARWCLLGDRLDMIALAALAGWTAIGLVGGLAFFRAAEYRYGG